MWEPDLLKEHDEDAWLHLVHGRREGEGPVLDDKLCEELDKASDKLVSPRGLEAGEEQLPDGGEVGVKGREGHEVVVVVEEGGEDVEALVVVGLGGEERVRGVT